MKYSQFLLLACLSLFAGSTIFPSSAMSSSIINGAGASFPYPIYSKWFAEYNKLNPEVRINYQSIGSGGGIRQLLKGTVDFGASDAPMKEEELSKAKFKVIHVPTVLGAVTISYNVPGVTGLQFTGEVVADIFMGKITKWNDPAIQALNKGASLPDAAIVTVHRADRSGTTSVFTDYLAKVSPEWKEELGEGKAIKWPTGLGAKGNEGIAGMLKNTPNSIGYIELVYAQTNKIETAKIKNRAGEFVAASPESVSKAAAGVVAEMVKNDFKLSITDAKGAGAYPISTFTWLLVYESMPSATGASIQKFINWALSEDGQKIASHLNYAPLPGALRKPVLSRVNKIALTN